jgi:hypothetical protein
MNTLITIIALLSTIGTSTLRGQAARQELQQQVRTRIYMISSRDTPCGSSTVPIPITVQGPRVLTQSLQVLLNTPDPHHPEYFTALEPHNLTLASVNITRQGTAEIRLRGSIAFNSPCDAARSRAQLERTALQFPTVKRVTIYLNGAKF